MKTALPGTALLALAGLIAASPLAAASGPGMCAGVCVEVTKVDPADVTTVTEIHNNVQTCAGNVNVQVGIDNEANYCSGNQTHNGRAMAH